MIVCSILGMTLLARRHRFEVVSFVGGNLGMALGTAVGGQMAAAHPVWHFLGMTLGMLRGMAADHEFAPALFPRPLARVTSP